MKKMPAVVAMLIPTSATQPPSVCGGCQVCVSADNATKITVCATTEYHVVSRASARTKNARVAISTPVRHPRHRGSR